jgi:hypothetical protein
LSLEKYAMASALHEVSLRVLFSLRYLHVAESQWDFYINYVPELGSPDLDGAFGGGSDQPILLAQNDWLRQNARPLINELRLIVPPDPDIRAGGIPVTLVGGFWAFSHYLSGWTQVGTDQIEWVKDLRFANGNPVQQGTQGKIAVATLSDAAKASLARLDGFAVLTARERFAKKVSGATLFSPGTRVLPKRTRVFISYRRPEIDIARALHAVLAAYGHGAVFEPYLDLHELELGSLRGQLRDRIVEWADIFVPLVSNDYAAPGSVSAEELGWARERAARSQPLASFIAPVYVSDPYSAVAAEFADLLRGNVASPSDVTATHEGLRGFLVACARA